MTVLSRRTASVVVSAAVVVWAITVGAGLMKIWAYSTTPGEAANAPATWPVSSTMDRPRDRPTLVMFVHPLCSCTSASLAELGEILRRVGDHVTGVVVFIQPRDLDDGWDRGRAWSTAQRLPGVRIRTDIGGTEAKRFGASTSGQVLVYDASGALRFAGGITGTRGHEGDNPGRRRVLSILNGDSRTPGGHSVFGCPLQTPGTSGL